jgi:DNA-binding MarR family transcriptional regulator
MSDADRDAIIHEILDEMTNWEARDRMGIFRKWLQSQVSLVHLHVLTVIEADGPLPMSKLADALDVSVASATGIVDRMEQRGLVRRIHSKEDRRVVLVEKTEAGDDVFKSIGESRRAGLAHILSSLTEDELRGYLAGTRAIRRARAAAAAMFAAKGSEAVDPATATESRGDATR